MSRQVLNVFREGESTATLGILFQCSQSKEVLPHLQMEFAMLQFVPIALVLSLGTTEKNLAPSS